MQFLLTGLMVIAEENCSRQETFLFGDLKTTVAFTVLERTISAGAITWVRGWSGPGGEIREEGTPRRWAVMFGTVTVLLPAAGSPLVCPGQRMHRLGPLWDRCYFSTWSLIGE